MYTGLGLEPPRFNDFFYPDGSRRLVTPAMLANLASGERALYTDYSTTELSQLRIANPDLIIPIPPGLFRNDITLNRATTLPELELYESFGPATPPAATVTPELLPEDLTYRGISPPIIVDYEMPAEPLPYFPLPWIGPGTPLPPLPGGTDVISPTAPTTPVGGGAMPFWGWLALGAAAFLVLARR